MNAIDPRVSAAIDGVCKRYGLNDDAYNDIVNAVRGAGGTSNTSNTDNNKKNGANGSDNANPNPWTYCPQNCKNMKTGEYNARAMSRQSFLAKTDLALAERFATEAGRKLGDTRAIVA